MKLTRQSNRERLTATLNKTMHSQKPISPPEIAVHQGDENNLIRWLSDPRGQKYFGHTFTLRADVLVAVITGGNLAAVARQHGVTRAAASKQARLAKSIFGNQRLTKSVI